MRARISMPPWVCSGLYLVCYFTPVSAIAGRSHLRSAASGLLSVPRTNTSTIGPRTFVISSPTAWNCLPVDLRDPGHSLLTFRRKLICSTFHFFSHLVQMKIYWLTSIHVICCSCHLFLLVSCLRTARRASSSCFWDNFFLKLIW